MEKKRNGRANYTVCTYSVYATTDLGWENHKFIIVYAIEELAKLYSCLIRKKTKIEPTYCKLTLSYTVPKYAPPLKITKDDTVYMYSSDWVRFI